MNTFQDIQSAIAALGDTRGIAMSIAKEATSLLQEEFTSSLSSGTSPTGKPWAPLKRGDGPPYAKAASKLTVTQDGVRISAKITGPEAFGNYGTKRMQRRQLLPYTEKGLPENVEQTLEKASIEVFHNLTK